MEETDAASILAVLTQETVRRRKQNHALKAAWAVIMVLQVVAAGALWFRKHEFDTSMFATFLLLTTTMTAGMTGAHKAAVKAAAALHDKQALGPLLEILHTATGDTDITTLAQTTIRLLAPQVEPTDTDLLDAPQRAALYRLLQTSNNTDLVNDLLSMVEKTAPVDAIPPLEALVRSARFAVAPEQREAVIDRARRTLASVRFRVAREVILSAGNSPTLEIFPPSALIATESATESAATPPVTVPVEGQSVRVGLSARTAL